MADQPQFNSFKEFYPYYLSQHQNRWCRYLHFAGLLVGSMVLISALIKRIYIGIPIGFILGYSCSWLGHFYFEHNLPATLRYPLYSFAADWVMLSEWVLTSIRKQ